MKTPLNIFPFPFHLFACEKAFPFAVVRMFVVLSGKLLCLTSWMLSWFLKLQRNPVSRNHYSTFISKYEWCQQENNLDGYPKSVLQLLARASPSLSNLSDSHTLHKLHWNFLGCPLSPELDFLSAVSRQQHIPSTTQRIKEACQRNSWLRKWVIHQCVYLLRGTRSILSMVTKRI